MSDKKFVTVDGIGTRKVKKRTTVTVKDEATGLSHLEDTVVSVEEVQPILTAEEAEVLEGADWKPTPKHLIGSGKFMCIAAGRRFFADVIPKIADKSKVKDDSPHK
jgi:hypothetical protein